MRSHAFRTLFVFASAVAVVPGADITGTVVVTRRLTKASVTAPAGAYQRGSAVQLAAARSEDPLEYERRHVAIYLEGDLPSKPVTAVMQQKGRAFSPDMLVVPRGSEVQFPNLDVIFHNVFSLSGPKSFDLGNYPMGQSRTVKFTRTGAVFVYCRLHSNMSAQIVITPNSWIAAPDAAGHFAISDVPPGQYTVVAWNKSTGELRRKVELSKGRGADVTFLVPVTDAPHTAVLGK